MIALAFTLPKAHYIVEFEGDDRQHKAAEQWCDSMIRSGFFIEIDDEGSTVFHFDNALDAADFRNQFRKLCGQVRTSPKRFPLLP